MKLGFYDFSKISLRKFWTEILFQIINYATYGNYDVKT